MANSEIMDENALRRAIIRLSHEVNEHNKDLSSLVFIGIIHGGEIVARRIQKYILSQTSVEVPCAGIDISAYRDDVSAIEKSSALELGVEIEGKTVILCDDVLHTGRSVRAALAGIFSVGRPAGVQLLVLADRGGREVPVRADYVGKNVPVSRVERIEVSFEEQGKKDRMYITKIN